MAGVNIPDMLAPGDKVEIEYLTRGGDVLTMIAVHQVEKSLDADPRFDLWSYRFEERVDLETGTNYRYVIFTVRYRESPKNDPERVYEAGLLIPVTVILAALAVVLVYALDLKRAVVLRETRQAEQQMQTEVLNDPNLTAAQKADVLGKQAESRQAGQQRSGWGLSSIVASLGTGGLIVAGLVLYAIFKRPTRSAPMWE